MLTYGSTTLFAPNCRRLLLTAALVLAGWAPMAHAATAVPIVGEIERITINDPTDHWSGGTIQVGGQIVILPRNLLLDLPANRLTLKQLYDQAPAICVAAAQTGLAKADGCSFTGTGGFASISANRTNAGNVIAGDVLIQKGTELVTGTVSYVDYTDGYYRLNGIVDDPTTGAMVRLNDPSGRHTVQQGLGCAGGPNCSADPRFALDPDNYTNVFSTGYPVCVPSTLPRQFTDILDLNTNGDTAELLTAEAAADGSGDSLCPQTNRPAPPLNPAGPLTPVADSRRFAPVQVGDSITAEGNFETVNGVRFLSAHTTMVNAALATDPTPGSNQPDYIFLDEVEMDAPGWENERIRTLIIGYATQQPADVLVWTLHRDPATNEAHEFPLASTRGCDTAGGAGTCARQGLATNGTDIFKIHHDVDFLVGADGRLNPCAHLIADPRMGTGFCPGGAFSTVQMMGILSPLPHEIQARTGRKVASLQVGGTPLVSIDVNGNEATNGQYLFPFGINLGGVAFAEQNEINLNGLNKAHAFSGIPWNLDRRLSPNGCIDTNGDGVVDCELSPQPLDPFPFEGYDPRTQALTPAGTYNDPHFTASLLSDSRNRILSYVDPALGKFNGNATLLAWPPADPGTLPITPTQPVTLACTDTSGGAGGTAPTANPDSATTTGTLPVTIAVLANDTDPNGDPLAVTAVTQPAGGTAALNADSTITFTANAGFTGSTLFAYSIADGTGGSSASAVTLTVAADVLTVTNRVYRAAINRWVVRGTASPILGQTITVTVASTDGVPCAGNCTVGTAVVDASGGWSLVTTAGPAVSGAGQLRITSSMGGARTVNYNFLLQ